jgi:kynurenine formamidase
MIDLSHSLTSTINVCNGHPSFECKPVHSIGPNSVVNVSALSFGTHTGTHIDAPYHFFPDGEAIADLDISRLVAPAIVIDVRNKSPHEKISRSDISPYESILKAGVVALFCTGWSKYWCKHNYPKHPSLTAEVAQFLIDSGVRVVGIDAMSPDDMPDDGTDVFDVHNIILRNGGIIAENLTNLEVLLGLPDPVVSLLPIKIDGADGAPIRAVAWSAHETVRDSCSDVKSSFINMFFKGISL